MAFRMSGFVLFNTPILFGTILVTQTPFNIMLWQFVNQSYNAGTNYANRNASSPYTNKEMLKGYAGAVSASIIISVGLNRLFLPITRHMSGAKRLVCSTIFNWSAVSAANATNIILMRNKELTEGVAVKDKDGNVYDKSIKAGKTALTQTVLSHMIIPFSVMFGPAMIVAAMKSANRMPANRLVSVSLEVALCAMALTVSLPIAMAAFPQKVSLPAEKLEPRFHGLKNDKGETIDRFFFNKGL